MEVDQVAGRVSDLQVVDVRHDDEWDAGHIDGSRHIVLDDLNSRLSEIDRDRPVVTVCRSGNRSANAAEILRAEGFDAQNLEGGLSAWAAASHPLVTSSGEPGEVVGDNLSPDLAHLQDVFLEMIMSVKEHFGDHDPSEEEVRQFLRDRLIAEGSTPEQADRFLDEL